MNRKCQRLTIEVPDLFSAAEDYRLLLQCEPDTANEERCHFALKDLIIELRQTEVQSAAITQLVLEMTAQEKPAHSPLAAFQLSDSPPLQARTCIGLDMIVYMTKSPAEVRQQLAISPLNLKPRKTIPLKEQGTEISFYDLTNTTLELAENPMLAEGEDGFWGLGLRVADIDTYHRYLTDSGVEISGIRPGQKRNTRVASIKSHQLGLPTLLVGAAQSIAT